jgi:hypothetical protein
MRTLGIDLASQPKKTAACVIDWGTNGAVVQTPILNVTDHRILDLAADCGAVGIDAPFGWPQPFIEFVCRDRVKGNAPPPYDNVTRDRLRFRLTDFRVCRDLGRWPLSVSSDRIALAAMRCVGLRAALEASDTSGTRRIVEVYPAVALKVWGFASSKYKSNGPVIQESEGNLSLLVDRFCAACPRLAITSEALQLLSTNDDCFDALISSLVARAAVISRTIAPRTAEEVDRASNEGWIEVPDPGSLAELLGPSTQN